MFPIGDLSDIISPIRNWMILKLFYWQKFIFEFSDSRCCHLQFFGIKNLKIHLRKFHNQSRHECFYETCHLGPFRNFLSLTSHINKVHGIDSYVNLKDGYRIHSETYPSEIDSGEIVKKETSKKEIIKKVTSKKEILMEVIVKKEEMMENLKEITVDWTRILSCTAILIKI